MRKKINKMLKHIALNTEVFGASLVPVISVDNKQYFVLFKRKYGHFTGKYAPLGGHAKYGETGIQAATRESYEETNGHLIVLPEDVLHVALPGNWPTFFAITELCLNDFAENLNHEHTGCKLVEISENAVLWDEELSLLTRAQLYDFITRKAH